MDSDAVLVQVTTTPTLQVSVWVGEALEVAASEGGEGRTNCTLPLKTRKDRYELDLEPAPGQTRESWDLRVSEDGKGRFDWNWPGPGVAVGRFKLHSRTARIRKLQAQFVVRRRTGIGRVNDQGWEAPAGSVPVVRSVAQSPDHAFQSRPHGARPGTQGRQERPQEELRLLTSIQQAAEDHHRQSADSLRGLRQDVYSWLQQLSHEFAAVEASSRAEPAEHQDRLLARLDRAEADRERLRAQLDEKEKARSNAAAALERIRLHAQALDRNQPKRIVDRLGRVLDLAEASEPASATGQALAPDRVKALGQYLNQIASVVAHLDCAQSLEDRARDMLGKETPPLIASRQALEQKHVGEALDHYLAYLKRSSDDSSEGSEEYYSGLVRGEVKAVWTSSGATAGSFEPVREAVDQLLRVLSLEVIIPDEGMTFNHKTQQTVKRVSAPDGYARNSIVKVVNPGFRVKGGDVIEKAQVSIAKD